jgi:CheY-like chemotaxis protein
MKPLCSRNGEDALAKFSQIQPDLVLLDVLLPRMNGWDVCKKLKETEAGRNTPIILMSAVYKNYKMQQDAREKYAPTISSKSRSSCRACWIRFPVCWDPAKPARS